MTDSPDARVSAAERDRALQELSRHFSLGRLSTDDFDVRSARAVAAVTRPQLAGLFADLPTAPPTAVPLAATPTAPRVAVLTGALVVFGLTMASTSGHWAWLLLLAGVPAVVLLCRRRG